MIYIYIYTHICIIDSNDGCSGCASPASRSPTTYTYIYIYIYMYTHIHISYCTELNYVYYIILCRSYHIKTYHIQTYRTYIRRLLPEVRPRVGDHGEEAFGGGRAACGNMIQHNII